jgi:hypothetical protein
MILPFRHLKVAAIDFHAALRRVHSAFARIAGSRRRCASVFALLRRDKPVRQAVVENFASWLCVKRIHG